MKSITIGDQEFRIKDYYCSPDGEYCPKRDGKLWLYVQLTDVCPAACPFCVNPGRRTGETPFDLFAFEETLRRIREHVCGVSFTGGEPMLTPELLDRAILVTREVMGPEVEIDMVTNGIGLELLPGLVSVDCLDSVHLSRHRLQDPENEQLMGIRTPGKDSIARVISQIKDPGLLVFNCLLSKDGVHSAGTMAEYLEMAADVGVRNTSFIGMMPVNEYCAQQQVQISDAELEKDPRFQLLDRFYDHEYCSCRSGFYQAKRRYVRFYFRSAGEKKAPYARQLVYTHDNRLLKGFGGEEVRFSF